MKLDATVIVIPYLNEEQLLRATVESLGFGLERETDVYLVLVDNGSIDASADIASEIRDTSPPGKVLCVSESERGYVPARDSGNRNALAWMRVAGYPPERVLILQADADTTYSPSYARVAVDAVAASETSGFFECQTAYPRTFEASHSDYFRLCADVDAEFEFLLAEEAPRVITDDKAVGYLLSDYYLWGGHRREWLTTGEEIHAESSRLLMRAMTYGSQLCPIDGAIAEHSVRRVIEEPLRDFATVGFPRERTWRPELCRTYEDSDELRAIAELRRKFTMALFGLLPIHVERAMGGAVPSVLNGKLALLPKRTVSELRTSPVSFIEDAFTVYMLLD
jgi:glycosyltransferase involved in cell wall biosynthesis